MRRGSVFAVLCLALLAAAPGSAQEKPLKPGDTFRDCPKCPLMRIVPAGRFEMGDRAGIGDIDESPVVKMRIPKMFAIGVLEVTRGEWRACVETSGCIALPNQMAPVNPRLAKLPWVKAARQREEAQDIMPLTHATWFDADAYLFWLSGKTGKTYRLPSEAEWEYAARAGTTSPWACGADGTCVDKTGWHAENSGKKIKPAGKRAPNAFGLKDMAGGVWEWTADCWEDGHRMRPKDGKARTVFGECDRRVIRGGSFYDPVWSLRPARREGYSATVRETNVGFRVLREIE